MSLIGLVLTLVVVGVGLWLLNTYGGPYIAPPILTIINVVVIICVIMWLLTVFGLLPLSYSVPVPRAR